MGRKQQLGTKKIRKCASIIGKPVISACINGGDLPHYTAIAWTGGKSAYIVNLKKETALEYVREGKFILKRVTLPFKVFVTPLTEEKKAARMKEKQMKLEEKDGNDWAKEPKKDNETIYQKYLRSCEELKQDVRDAVRKMQYGDMT